MEEKSKLEIIKEWYEKQDKDNLDFSNIEIVENEHLKNLIISNIFINYCCNSQSKSEFDLIFDILWPESDSIEDFFKLFKIITNEDKENLEFYLLLSKNYDGIVDEEVILNWKVKKNEPTTIN